MPEKPLEIHYSHDEEVNQLALRRVSSRKRTARLIVKCALRAAELGDYGPPPPGFTKQEHTIAMDARLPKRDAPYYLEIAKQITSDSDRAPEEAQSLNIGTVNIVQAMSYPTKRIEGK